MTKNQELRTENWRAVLALMLGATAIGFAPIFVKYALAEGIGPTAIAFWRFLLSLPFFWLLSTWKKRGESARRAAPLERSSVLLMCAAGVFFACDFSVWHRSLQYTTAANSTFLANLAPIFVTFGAWFFFRQKITTVFLAGMAMAIGGVGVLMGDSLGFGGDRLLGDALGVTTAVFYGSYQLTIKKLRGKLPTAFILFRVYLVSTVILLVVTLASGEALLGEAYTARGWLVIGALAIVSHVFGQGLIAWALARLSAPFASVGLVW